MLLLDQRNIHTTLGNYVELGYYLLVLYAANSSKKLFLWHGLIDIILLLNIVLLTLYPGANIHYTNELHFDSLGYPDFLKNVLLTTIPAFVLTIFVLKRNRSRQIALLIIYLLVASKTTNLILVIVFLLFNFSSSFLLLILAIPLFILMKEYIGLSEYLLERINTIISLDVGSDEFARLPLMYNSITSFIQSPIFGIGYLKIDFEDINELLRYSIGHHSHLFDNLGRFGVIWLLVLYREIKKYWGSKSSFVYMGVAWSVLNNLISLGSASALFILINHENDSDSIRIKRWRC